MLTIETTILGMNDAYEAAKAKGLGNIEISTQLVVEMVKRIQALKTTDEKLQNVDTDELDIVEANGFEKGFIQGCKWQMEQTSLNNGVYSAPNATSIHETAAKKANEIMKAVCKVEVAELPDWLAGLNNRTATCLYLNKGYTSIEQIQHDWDHQSHDYFTRIPNFGNKCLKDLEQWLAKI